MADTRVSFFEPSYEGATEVRHRLVGTEILVIVRSLETR